MNRTYITKVPDKSGSFLKASYIISEAGGNIIRVNYNKAVDIHTMFIEVSATEEQHSIIGELLGDMGYLHGNDEEKQLLLIVLTLPDEVGAVTPVLEIMEKYKVNISYMNSQSNGTPFQYFKMGLLIENEEEVKALLEEVSKICEVKIMDYDVTKKQLDGTVFYITFANEMRKLLNLNQEQTNTVLIQSNQIMQNLDDRSGSPMKTFDYIHHFAQFVINHKGDNFHHTIEKTQLTEETALYLIRVPCGSNTIILENGNDLLFVDCGFPCYRNEMLHIFYNLFPDFDSRKKEIMITHGDIDHTGLLDLFEKVYMVQSCYDNFELELKGLPDFREQNEYHAPYCILSKIITGYVPPELDKAVVIGKKVDEEPVSKIGELDFHDLHFDVLEGDGGHVRGETVFVCENPKIVFTGDIFVNIKGFSDDEKEFNKLAPYLMTSVNVDSKKATRSREFIMENYKGYVLYAAHGSPYEMKIKVY